MRVFIGTILVVICVLALWLGIDNVGQVGTNYGEAWKTSSVQNNNGSTADETAANRQPGCANTTLVVAPGETETYERHIACRNLNWERQEGPTLETLFVGNNGEKEVKWYSGHSVMYDGKVTSIKFMNTGDSPVQIELWYQ